MTSWPQSSRKSPHRLFQTWSLPISCILMCWCRLRTPVQSTQRTRYRAPCVVKWHYFHSVVLCNMEMSEANKLWVVFQTASGPCQLGTGQKPNCAHVNNCISATKSTMNHSSLMMTTCSQVSLWLCFILPAWNASPPETHARNMWLLFALYQQVSVTAREDVPPFGPPLPNPAVFRKVRDRAEINTGKIVADQSHESDHLDLTNSKTTCISTFWRWHQWLETSLGVVPRLKCY